MQDTNSNKLSRSGNIPPGTTLNPNGRPRGATGKKFRIKDRLLGKWRTHPVDKLVTLAKLLQDRGQYEEAAEIWANLLKYFEPTKKPVETKPEPTDPDESKEAAEETFKLLQELEQHGLGETKGSKRSGVATRKTDVSSKAGSETDLSGDKSK